jgi:cation transporter-like permease
VIPAGHRAYRARETRRAGEASDACKRVLVFHSRIWLSFAAVVLRLVGGLLERRERYLASAAELIVMPPAFELRA